MWKVRCTDPSGEILIYNIENAENVYDAAEQGCEMHYESCHWCYESIPDVISVDVLFFDNETWLEVVVNIKTTRSYHALGIVGFD
jgi:hypothetical protein